MVSEPWRIYGAIAEHLWEISLTSTISKKYQHEILEKKTTITCERSVENNEAKKKKKMNKRRKKSAKSRTMKSKEMMTET